MSGLALELFGLAVSLALVLAAAFIFLRILKRFQPSGARSAEIAFIRAIPVGPRERIVLVRWREEELLIGVAPGGVTMLTRGAAPPAPEPAVASPQSAAALPSSRSLQKALRALWDPSTSDPRPPSGKQGRAWLQRLLHSAQRLRVRHRVSNRRTGAGAEPANAESDQ